jgi:hypothetical protein
LSQRSSGTGSGASGLRRGLMPGIGAACCKSRAWRPYWGRHAPAWAGCGLEGGRMPGSSLAVPKGCSRECAPVWHWCRAGSADGSGASADSMSNPSNHALPDLVPGADMPLPATSCQMCEFSKRHGGSPARYTWTVWLAPDPVTRLRSRRPVLDFSPESAMIERPKTGPLVR